MTKELLFASMCGIDDAILERSERATAHRYRLWKNIMAAAACFGIILATAALVPTLFPGKTPAPSVADVTPPQVTPSAADGNETSNEPQRTWTATYNTPSFVLDVSMPYIPGYFTEELNALEIAAIEPDRRMDWMEYSGDARFDGDGNLIAVYLSVTTPFPDTSIYVAISESAPFRYCMPSDEPIISPCGDVDYTIYQSDMGASGVLLEANAEINGCWFTFSMTVFASLEQAKEAFQQVLECFSYYPEDGSKPALSAITAESIPEWFDRTLTQAEALDDPTFGAHMLKNIPAGFAAESIRRYKDQNSDYLSGLWTRGYDSFRWNVSYFSETDSARLTSVADTENYDLSLYPIPRADSVPHELRKIVDNPIFDADELTLETVCARAYKVNDVGDADGWRMNFSVKYGDILVKINAKGVEPEWVYEQLISLR